MTVMSLGCLFSLFAMTLIEFIQRVTRARQKGLEEVIQKLIGVSLTKQFYKHALVNPLEAEKPSYISPALFAKVIMDWLLPNGGELDQNKKPSKSAVNRIVQGSIKSLARINRSFGGVLECTVEQANMKTGKVSEYLDAIQKDLESWFLEAVHQMSPVYAKRLQGLTFAVSLVVAVIANFDVISIISRLWEASKYTELLTLAEKSGQMIPPVDMNTVTMLPVGWYFDYFPVTPTQWLLKALGIYLGTYFIIIGSQYAYNLSKGQYKPAK